MDSYVVYCKGILSPNLPLLTIPVADASVYSTKPLKWIRYICAAILGSEGELIRYTENEDTNDYHTLDLEDGIPSQRTLLFVPGAPIKFIDPMGLDHLQSSQFTTESHSRFEGEVLARDRKSVVTGTVYFARAYHLIPHSKGNEYIQTLFRWRAATEESEIADINDIRNGIFMDDELSKYLAIGELGVLPAESIFIQFSVELTLIIYRLQTPNFALTTTEVLPEPTQHNSSFRFTPHYYFSDEIPGADPDPKMYMYIRDFRHPTNIVNGWPENWPPALLWDFLYGIVIARKYGNQDALEFLNNQDKSKYYPEGVQTAINQARAAIEAGKKKKEREAREQRNAPDIYDTVFSLWMRTCSGPDQQKARDQKMAESERCEQEMRALTAERINMWRKEVEDLNK